ncbi:hypothetical protein ACJJJB_00315 (plasmid) [Microbulbifer sp. ANSA001]|uniref:hypothetical protein n=1 Tax=Microbulbifer sp. ANSA001 TaxID=3243358 RepID=UPI00404122AF
MNKHLSCAVSANNPGSGCPAAAISVAPHSVKYAFGEVSYDGGEVSGLPLGQKYHVYCDDPGYNGGGLKYKVVTSFSELVTWSGAHYVGTITVPAAEALK